MGNKQDKCAAATGAGVGAILGGVGLMIFGGPPGMVAGMAALSGGIGGVSNAQQQASDPNQKDFSALKFIGHTALNSAAGVIPGGAGSALATTALSTGARIAVVAGVSAAGNSAT